MNSLTQNWWLIVLRGVAAVLFGISAFVWPGMTWLVLVALFGAYALVDGVIAVVSGLRHTKDSSRWWVFLLEGLLGIGVGVIALIWPGVAALTILAMIAAWAIITGVLEVVAAIRLRRELTNEWLLALGGVLSVALGVLLIVQPLAGSLAVIWMIGAYSLMFGVVLISLGIRLRNWNTSDRPSRMSPSTPQTRA
jgi:uncharacterized membrane protein HdeD (DUF308 family)